jgi:hypothetical protein
VLEKAAAFKSNPFVFQRTFNIISPTGPIGSGTSQLEIRVATEAAGGFSIRRMELYFPNRRAEMTIPQYVEDLKAYAEIRFNGSGLLEGRWEVDGRTIETVKQYLTFGGLTILESPKAPILPTFETGTHMVKFVIQKPVVDFPLPAIVYFVVPRSYPEKRPLVLLKPEAGAQLPFGPLDLTWGPQEGAGFYLLEFSEEGRVIFSAMTKTPSYTLNQAIMDHYFLPGRPYEWRVKGFDDRGRNVMESEGRSLSFVKGEE